MFRLQYINRLKCVSYA